MAAKQEILALAVVEAFDGKDEECLRVLSEFYGMLRHKGYSRDVLYRDARNPRRLVNLRYWTSEESRHQAHEDPHVHKFWKRLSEISSVTTVFEQLEDVTPGEPRAQRQAP